MIDRRTFAHLPFRLLDQQLESLLARRVNPEIAFTCEALDALSPGDLDAAASFLRSNDLEATIHGPFMDLNPGAVDPLVRKATVRRFDQVFDAAAIIKPRVIVFHPGFDKWRYAETRNRWLDNSISFWRRFLPRAESIGAVIAIENIFEEEPSNLKELIEAVDSPFFRHCFDAGHWNLFGTVTMEQWFSEIGRHVAEVHLHDNDGNRDQHLPPGEGIIDFKELFSLLKKYAPHSAYTIEAHTLETLDRSLLSIPAFLP
jgi:sugar phosphate isomerase/epimerase